MKTIYFARHGSTVMNEAGIWSSTTDTPLTDTGRQQAKTAGLNAGDLGIDIIVASPLIRTLETATIIADVIGYPTQDILTNALLVERDFGSLEATPWKPNMHIDDYPGVESRDVLKARISQAIAWIENLPGNTVLIVSHGTAGRMLRHLLSVDVPFEQPVGFPNATIVKLR